jgi:hypothetical protein
MRSAAERHGVSDYKFEIIIVGRSELSGCASFHDSRPIREIIEAARRPESGAAFDLNLVMDGVTPCAALPTSYDHDFGLRAGTSQKRRLVNGAVVVEWEYASGNQLADWHRLACSGLLPRDGTASLAWKLARS